MLRKILLGAHGRTVVSRRLHSLNEMMSVIGIYRQLTIASEYRQSGKLAWLAVATAFVAKSSPCNELRLLELRVLGFGLLQDWNIWVGIFPESEEIVVRSAGIGGVALHGVGATELKMGKSTDG